jgi:hypothetical protein
VADVGGLERGARRRRVGERADEENVGVLAERVHDRVTEAHGVGADFALCDDRTLVGVQHLDRVLDGDDVARLVLVHVVEDRRERRGAARAGEARDEHHPRRGVGQALHARRQAQRVEPRWRREHAPHHETDPPALAERADPEPAASGCGVHEVGLTAVMEPLGPTRRHDREGHPFRLFGLDEVERRLAQHPVDPQHRPRPDLQVDVRRALFHRVPKELVEIEHEASSGSRSRRIGSQPDPL